MRLKRRLAYPSRLVGLRRPSRSSASRLGSSTVSRSGKPDTAAEYPEPLCLARGQGVLQRHLGGRYSPFLARMGSCARPSISAGLWFSLAPAVFAGCRQSLLTDGPSRYYPCTPCVGAWTHTPPSPVGAFALFFPTDIGLASRETRSAKRNYPCPATSPGSCFSRLQSFATFRLLRSLGPRIAPTAPPRGSEQLGRLHHALPGQLPVSSCGIAPCLI